MPDDLRAQIEPFHAMVKAMALPLLAVPGLQADDVLGTQRHPAVKTGRAGQTSPPDIDMARLVPDKMSYHLTHKYTTNDDY
ncbi:DNA polymerase I [Escherichia coli]|nr:DNA polymerase I [Escherichia coli]